MLFLNSILLLGLLGISVPIILHLIRRQAAKPMEWGAMKFLFDTVAMRRRRIEWEDLLLMATRCMLLTLIALAIARPFIPPNSSVPWMIVLPLVLLGVAALAGSVVLSQLKTRIIVRIAGVICLMIAVASVIMERQLNLKRFSLEGGRDVALVIDASTSMTMSQGGLTSFELAIEEARQVVKESPRGTAFSVILGGPAPTLKTATPLTHRADVLEVLDQLRPVGGPFRAQDALGVATLSLAQGDNAGKEILVLTDGQRIGWRTDSPSAWTSLGEALDSLPKRPRLMLRSYKPPENLRNLAVSDIELSRDVVGTDREVTLLVTIENTGTEPVTPGEIEVNIGDKTLEPGKLGQMIPGQQETVKFRHRFTQPGPQVIIARLDAKDDLTDDDRFERVVLVRKRLPVILVDGNPTGSFFERAAGFTALALTPSDALIRGTKAADGYLMEPEVIAAPDIAQLKDLAPQSVIVLADVPRLPAAIARKIERFVANGGGLLILTGQRSDASFYNSWGGADGQVIPVGLEEIQTERDGVTPAPDTFDHPMLSLFANEKKSDLGNSLISVFRKVDERQSARYVVARYANGEPFLTAKPYGQGRVVLATCGFDSHSSNLPAKKSFVPFIHEMITWLAGSGGVNLNLTASWSPTIYLPGGGGLRGEYYRGSKPAKQAIMTRMDPAIDFDWKEGSPDSKIPKDRFTVQWTGRLLPPASGEYKIEAKVDDRLEVEIDGRRIVNANESSNTSGVVTLVQGKAVSIKVTYVEDAGLAFASLSWTPPGGESSLVPSSVLFPPVEEKGGSELILEATEVIDPLGVKRNAHLAAGRRGRMIKVDGAAIPGLYQLKVPQEAADTLGGKAGSMIPLVVSRDVSESRLETLSDDDLALIGKNLDIVQVRNRDDILAVLSGTGFGEELWKLLAVAAFFLLLAEVALARWISKSRRAGEDVSIDFEHRGDPNKGFMDELNKLKEDGS
ncbi:MAG: hypothetical protein ACI9E1_000333 [Cryomorphaceae bacterium]|jgi:hypothetical protein